MQWTPGGTSSDIEDDRGESGGASGGGGGFGFGGGGGGFGGIHLGIGGTIIVLLLSWLFHTNLFSLVGGGGGGYVAPTTETERTGEPARERADSSVNMPGQDKAKQFVSFVLDDVQKNWDTQLPAQTNRRYHHAKLVLYRDSIPSACGQAQSATGPFYCPGDEKVYLDLGFFDELSQRFGAPGEFAEAYVIAHEIGHHVQKLLGIEAQSGAAAGAESARGESAFGEAGITGGLLCGGMGQFHRAAQNHRPERRGGGTACGGSRGRRPVAEDGNRACEP